MSGQTFHIVCWGCEGFKNKHQFGWFSGGFASSDNIPTLLFIAFHQNFFTHKNNSSSFAANTMQHNKKVLWFMVILLFFITSSIDSLSSFAFSFFLHYYCNLHFPSFFHILFSGSFLLWFILLMYIPSFSVFSFYIFLLLV